MDFLQAHRQPSERHAVRMDPRPLMQVDRKSHRRLHTQSTVETTSPAAGYEPGDKCESALAQKPGRAIAAAAFAAALDRLDDVGFEIGQDAGQGAVKVTGPCSRRRRRTILPSIWPDPDRERKWVLRQGGAETAVAIPERRPRAASMSCSSNWVAGNRRRTSGAFWGKVPLISLPRIEWRTGQMR